jgi:hypothetical protein
MVVLLTALGRVFPRPGVSRLAGHGVRSHRDLGSQIGTHDSVTQFKDVWETSFPQ